MAFRILIISVAALVGVLVGAAVMAELRSPTLTVIEPITLTPGEDAEVDEKDDKRPTRSKPRRSTGARSSGETSVPVVPEPDGEEGAQPVLPPPPARAGEDEHGDDGADDDGDDDTDDGDDGDD